MIEQFLMYIIKIYRKMMNERPKRKRNNTKFVDYLEEVPDEYIL